jgi:aryl-alcohol dehydrogenase-like predicted oxidoreductase
MDTAPYYGRGHSEEIVGKAVAGRRHLVIIATKCGLVWDAQNNKFGLNHPEGTTRRTVGEEVRAVYTHQPYASTGPQIVPR